MRVRWLFLWACLLFTAPIARAQVGASIGGSADAEFDDDFATKPKAQPVPKQSGSVSKLAPPVKQAPLAAPRKKQAPLEGHNTVNGIVGGVHAIDATSAPPGTFRVGLTGQLFKKNGFLIPSDRHRRMQGTFAVSVTPIEHLEIAASLVAFANENAQEPPGVFQVVGDGHLFVKGYTQVLPALAVSGDLELAMLNGVGGIGLLGSATSVGLRGAATLDLRKLPSPLPLILRSSLRYYFDNSSSIVEEIEDSRYASLSDARPARDETRHLASNVERFVFHVNRLDMLTWDLGLEAPLALAHNWTLSPIGEWSMGIPINRQGYDCLITDAPNDRDSCLEREGFAAWPTTLTMGLRVQPPLRGLSTLLAVDVATSGSETFVRELAPNAPYDLMLMVSYGYDVREPDPVIIEKRIEVRIEPEPRGHILGEVVDAETNLPVPQAIVHFEEQKLTDLATDEQGRFVSYELSPATYALRVYARDYAEGRCSATLATGGVDQSVRCEIVPVPKRGNLRGNVKNEAGLPVPGAAIKLEGPRAATLATDAQGSFTEQDLPVGRYTVTVDAPGFLITAASFTLANGETATPVLMLRAQPKVASAELRATDIQIKKQVQFVLNSAEISSESDLLLAEVADVLLRNPQVTRVEVQGHTDDQGTHELNMELSQKRADAVRDWLVRAGVAPERLTSVGYGRTRPRAPNITEQNRAKNRRVEFVILEQ